MRELAWLCLQQRSWIDGGETSSNKARQRSQTFIPAFPREREDSQRWRLCFWRDAAQMLGRDEEITKQTGGFYRRPRNREREPSQSGDGGRGQPKEKAEPRPTND